MLRAIDKAVEAAAVLAFAASSLMILINVVNRYFVLGAMRNLAKSFEWLHPTYLTFREAFGSISVMADEVPGYLLVWIAFLGAYLAMRQQGHISFDLLADRVVGKWRSALHLFNGALIGGFLCILLWQSIRMIRVSGGTEIETAEIAQGWFMLILPLAALLLLVSLFLQLRASLASSNRDH
jgi:TRAP-type C4-dicarboxylate transport system permease small subunit